MNPLKITIKTKPIAQSRPRVTRFSTYYPKRQQEYMDETKAYLSKLGIQPYKVPLSITISFYVNFPTECKVSEKKTLSGIFGFGKPDLDNLGKMIMDCMNKIVYEDDALISSVSLHKHFSSEPRTEITIREVAYGTEGQEMVDRVIAKRLKAKEKKASKIL